MKFLKIIGLLYFLIPAMVNGQNTFNHQLDLGLQFTVFTKVHATDSCYYTIGVIIDSMPGNKIGSLFTKFDLEGNILFSKKLVSSDISYSPWFCNLLPLDDGNMVDVVTSTDSVARVRVMRCDIKFQWMATSYCFEKISSLSYG
ncbi:MAG: hypothetical protein D6714_12310 [Bacteroidetes bacterium]|nr:MAG: hypothetical protein D6714_12310 [Bacteroidota bacterium]